VEIEPQSHYRSFNATSGRERIIRSLVLEFAGIELKITPTERSDDFQKHVELWFISSEQEASFISRMLELGQQEQARRQNLNRRVDF